MSKIIVTLKEPIRSDGDMKSVIEFDHVEAWHNQPLLYFGNVGEKNQCPIPIDNILGVTYKKDSEA